MGSNTAEAAEDADPSSEADDWSCCVTPAAGVSVVGLSGVALVTSEGKATEKAVTTNVHMDAC